MGANGPTEQYAGPIRKCEMKGLQLVIVSLALQEKAKALVTWAYPVIDVLGRMVCMPGKIKYALYPFFQPRAIVPKNRPFLLHNALPEPSNPYLLHFGLLELVQKTGPSTPLPTRAKRSVSQGV